MWVTYPRLAPCVQFTSQSVQLLALSLRQLRQLLHLFQASSCFLMLRRSLCFQTAQTGKGRIELLLELNMRLLDICRPVVDLAMSLFLLSKLLLPAFLRVLGLFARLVQIVLKL